MAISKNNRRIIITISEKQYNWITDFSNKKHLTKSKLISWLLAKKTQDVISTLNLNTNPKEEIAKTNEQEEITDEEIKDLQLKLEQQKNNNK